MLLHRFFKVFGGVEAGGGRMYGPGPPLESPWPGNKSETALCSL